jgi:hypothetical protein
VLRVINSSSKLRLYVVEKQIGTFEPGRTHEFCSIHLLPDAASSEHKDALHAIILEEIFSAPGIHLEWLREDFAVTLRNKLTTVILHGHWDAKSLLSPGSFVHESQFQEVMMLRGLLAGGVLVHCLQKRRNVNFGIPLDGRKKRGRIAVPFIAADTPSPTSEFAHHDCALFYTMVSYYADGLSANNLLEALNVLLSLGPTAQRKTYDVWFKESERDITDMERCNLREAA